MIAIVSSTTLLSHYNHSVLSLKEPEDKMLPAGKHNQGADRERKLGQLKCRIFFFLKREKREKGEGDGAQKWRLRMDAIM